MLFSVGRLNRTRIGLNEKLLYGDEVVDSQQDDCAHERADESGRLTRLSRRSFVGRLPRPDHALGGSGAVPGAHTVVPGRIPTA